MSGGHRVARRLSRGKLLAAAGALAVLFTAASLAVSPAQAERASTDDERERALAHLATCQAMRAEAETSAERSWANACIRLAQRWVDRLTSPSPPASPTALPSSPTSAPTTQPPTTSPSTTAAPRPSPTPTGACATERFPTAACTGVAPGWVPARTVTGDLRITTPGMVLDRVRVTGSVQVQAHNVRIVNSEIWGQVKNQYSGHIYDGLRVEASTIGPPTGVARFSGGIIEGTGYTAIGNHMRNNVEGPRNGGFGYGGRQAGPVVLVGNYIRLRGISGVCSHTDGLQGYDESDHAIIRNNTFALTGISCTTAAIYIGFPFGADEVTDNLLLGGDSYVMRLEGTGSHFNVVRGNRLVRGSWSSALARVAACSTVGVWQDNRSATIAADGSVIDGPLLTTCPESTQR